MNSRNHQPVDSGGVIQRAPAAQSEQPRPQSNGTATSASNPCSPPMRDFEDQMSYNFSGHHFFEQILDSIKNCREQWSRDLEEHSRVITKNITRHVDNKMEEYFQRLQPARTPTPTEPVKCGRGKWPRVRKVVAPPPRVSRAPSEVVEVPTRRILPARGAKMKVAQKTDRKSKRLAKVKQTRKYQKSVRAQREDSIDAPSTSEPSIVEESNNEESPDITMDISNEPTDRVEGPSEPTTSSSSEVLTLEYTPDGLLDPVEPRKDQNESENTEDVETVTESTPSSSQEPAERDSMASSPEQLPNSIDSDGGATSESVLEEAEQSEVSNNDSISSEPNAEDSHNLEHDSTLISEESPSMLSEEPMEAETSMCSETSQSDLCSSEPVATEPIAEAVESVAVGNNDLMEAEPVENLSISEPSVSEAPEIQMTSPTFATEVNSPEDVDKNTPVATEPIAEAVESVAVENTDLMEAEPVENLSISEPSVPEAPEIQMTSPTSDIEANSSEEVDKDSPDSAQMDSVSNLPISPSSESTDNTEEPTPSESNDLIEASDEPPKDSIDEQDHLQHLAQPSNELETPETEKESDEMIDTTDLAVLLIIRELINEVERMEVIAKPSQPSNPADVETLSVASVDEHSSDDSIQHIEPTIDMISDLDEYDYSLSNDGFRQRAEADEQLRLIMAEHQRRAQSTFDADQLFPEAVLEEANVPDYVDPTEDTEVVLNRFIEEDGEFGEHQKIVVNPKPSTMRPLSFTASSTLRRSGRIATRREREPVMAMEEDLHSTEQSHNGSETIQDMGVFEDAPQIPLNHTDPTGLPPFDPHFQMSYDIYAPFNPTTIHPSWQADNIPWETSSSWTPITNLHVYDNVPAPIPTVVAAKLQKKKEKRRKSCNRMTGRSEDAPAPRARKSKSCDGRGRPRKEQDGRKTRKKREKKNLGAPEPADTVSAPEEPVRSTCAPEIIIDEPQTPKKRSTSSRSTDRNHNDQSSPAKSTIASSGEPDEDEEDEDVLEILQDIESHRRAHSRLEAHLNATRRRPEETSSSLSLPKSDNSRSRSTSSNSKARAPESTKPVALAPGPVAPTSTPIKAAKLLVYHQDTLRLDSAATMNKILHGRQKNSFNDIMDKARRVRTSRSKSPEYATTATNSELLKALSRPSKPFGAFTTPSKPIATSSESSDSFTTPSKPATKPPSGRKRVAKKQFTPEESEKTPKRPRKTKKSKPSPIPLRELPSPMPSTTSMSPPYRPPRAASLELADMAMTGLGAAPVYQQQYSALYYPHVSINPTSSQANHNTGETSEHHYSSL